MSGCLNISKGKETRPMMLFAFLCGCESDGNGVPPLPNDLKVTRASDGYRGGGSKGRSVGHCTGSENTVSES